MSTFIGIETVVMNALIEAFEKREVCELSFDDIVFYGKAAERIYQRDTGEDAILLLSREDQVSMMESYPQYLDMSAYMERGAFRLRENVPIDEIKELFRWSLNVNLYKAFTSPDAVQGLLEN